MSRSRPACHDVSNKGIAITNCLDVDGLKLLSVNKCHSILFVWTYDSNVGTIDGPDHIWKVRNIKIFAWCQSSYQGMTGNVLFVSQLPLKPCELPCMQQIQKHQINRQQPTRKFQLHEISKQLELAALVSAADLFLSDVEDLYPKFLRGQ